MCFKRSEVWFERWKHKKSIFFLSDRRSPAQRTNRLIRRLSRGIRICIAFMELTLSYGVRRCSLKRITHRMSIGEEIWITKKEFLSRFDAGNITAISLKYLLDSFVSLMLQRYIINITAIFLKYNLSLRYISAISPRCIMGNPLVLLFLLE